MYVERRDAETAVVAPCCAAQGQPCSNDQVNFDTNPFLLRLRQENLAGIASKECAVCWQQELHTGRSLRTSSLEFYKQPGTQRSGLLNLDWNVEPICNAKCIICSNYHSSAWLAEDQKFSEVLFPISRSAATARANDIIDNINFDSIYRVYFNGGEPVLSQDPVKILTKLDQIGKLESTTVGFNMNGSCMPSAELISLLQKARSVTVYFSIDGVGSQFEYIRYPLSWPTVTENIKKIMQLNFNSLIMTTALGIHNIHIAQQTEDWWLELASHGPSCTEFANTYQLVVGPLSIDSASERLKQQLHQEFDSTKSSVNQWIVNSLNGASGTDQWISWLQRLDQRRSLDWRQALPKLYQAAVAAGVVK